METYGYMNVIAELSKAYAALEATAKFAHIASDPKLFKILHEQQRQLGEFNRQVLMHIGSQMTETTK